MQNLNHNEWLLFRISLEKTLKKIKDRSCEEQMNVLIENLLEGDETFLKTFSDDKGRLEKKITKTFNFVKNYKKFSDVEAAVQSITTTHLAYANLEEFNFDFFITELISFLKSVLGDHFTPAFEEAWCGILYHIVSLMRKAMISSNEVTMISKSFIEDIGGREKIENVHRRMYEKLFDDEWLGQFFFAKSQKTLIRKQTDFVMASAGYQIAAMTESPYAMHMHMYITEEIYNIRQVYLKQSMREENLSVAQIQLWIDFDNAFRDSIQKNKIDECFTRCPGQRPIAPKKPVNYVPINKLDSMT